MVERLPAIREQILSRSRLERIIRDLDLYKGDRSAGVMEDVVGRMRDAVDVKLDSKESFRVSFESDNPTTAQAVAQRLASLSIEENLKEQERTTEGTSQFLEAQLEDAKVRLLEKEKALEAYRQRHAGQLPSQLQSNLQSIHNAQQQLQTISESMNRARERRMLFERQLADAQIVVPVAATPGGPLAATPAPQTTAQQLDAARARREVYQGHYTADHPDMKALERSIRDLEAKLLEEGRTASQGTPARLLTTAEAARQKRVADLQAELDVIDHQLSASQVEATGLRRTINDFQSKVAVLPTRESELVELTRDYTTLQGTYSSLLTKMEDAKLAANLQRRQVGEQFTILDAASLPERPYNRALRLGLSFSGAVLGLAMGLGLVLFLEIRDTSLKSEEDVTQMLSVPVLALVPMMSSEREKQHHRKRALMANAAGVVVLLGSVAALVFWRLQS